MSPHRAALARTWSRRAYDLGDHATPLWAAACAAVALAAFLGSVAILMTDALFWPGADIFRVTTSMFIGPLGLSLAVVVLCHQSGQLLAPAALFTAFAAVPAWGLAALTAGSWSAGFVAADAGLDPGWFGAATLPFLAAGWVARTAALLPLIASQWGTPNPGYLRGLQNVLLAAPGALGLGAVFMIAFPLAPLAAATLLFVSLRAAKPNQAAERTPAGTPSEDVPVEDSPTQEALTPEVPPAVTQVKLPQRASSARRRRTAAAVIAAATLVFGLFCVGFALTGSTWSSSATGSTEAMNLGLAFGALNAIPVTVAASMMLQSRFGGVIRWTVLVVSGGLLFEAAAQFAGVEHPWQWPLTLTGGVLLGFGLALPLARLIPGTPLLRSSVTLGTGLAAAFIGVGVVAAAGFIAPVVSAALLIWCIMPSSWEPSAPQPA